MMNEINNAAMEIADEEMSNVAGGAKVGLLTYLKYKFGKKTPANATPKNIPSMASKSHDNGWEVVETGKNADSLKALKMDYQNEAEKKKKLAGMLSSNSGKMRMNKRSAELQSRANKITVYH